MKQVSQTHGIILRLGPSGESFTRVELVCPENGVYLCLKRISTKQSGKESPDLFDSADICLETSKQGNLQFISEYRVQTRRTGIGASYQALKYASDYCALIADNGPHMAEAERLYARTLQTLDALAAKKAPSVVFLKAIYILLKEEGYPVKELWWPNLSSELKSIARELLREAAPESLNTIDKPVVERLIRSLCIWLRNESDLRLPTTMSV